MVIIIELVIVIVILCYLFAEWIISKDEVTRLGFIPKVNLAPYQHSETGRIEDCCDFYADIGNYERSARIRSEFEKDYYSLEDYSEMFKLLETERFKNIEINNKEDIHISGFLERKYIVRLEDKLTGKKMSLWGTYLCDMYLRTKDSIEQLTIH